MWKFMIIHSGFTNMQTQPPVNQKLHLKMIVIKFRANTSPKCDAIAKTSYLSIKTSRLLLCIADYHIQKNTKSVSGTVMGILPDT